MCVLTLTIGAQGLAQWCTHGHSRRGLERWGSQLYAAFRGSNRSRSNSYIVSLQNQMSADGLRAESLNRTRASRLFARMMGEADATAVARSQFNPLLRQWQSDMDGFRERPSTLPYEVAGGTSHRPAFSAPSLQFSALSLERHHRRNFLYRTSATPAPRQGLVRMKL